MPKRNGVLLGAVTCAVCAGLLGFGTPAQAGRYIKPQEHKDRRKAVLDSV